MSEYTKRLETLKKSACPACSGNGERDDAEPGDISFKTWTCPDCNGSGLAAPASPKPVQELREELERLIDKWQDQRSGRPGWNAQQDCADDLRALLSRSTKEGKESGS